MSTLTKQLKKISQLPETTQQISLAALLSSLFAKYDVLLTVVGGAAVQYYSDATYVTKDLDVILMGDTTEIIEETMHSLGFKRTTMYRHFEHPSLPFVVEFPPSPIEVGSRTISKVNILNMDDKSVRVIRVEDMIMDRIIAAVEWKDTPSLEQAKLLWLMNNDIIDVDYLKTFATEEGYSETLQEVMIITPVS